MKKILVIDDTLHLLEEISDLLKMEGYEVVTAHEAIDGMHKAEKIDPDLIVTDILMPGMDGFELIAQLRATPKHRHTPIIVLSAQAAKENEEKAKALNANNYLRKPCAADELLLSIESLLKQQNGTHTNFTGR